MQLLLESALLEKSQARVSWQRYLQENDLQTIDHSAIALLPLVYRNLKDESHHLCKSAYRHTWLNNQNMWRNIRKTLNTLHDAGIEKIALLKGMGLILGHYHDFGVRTLGDIDILIDRAYVPLAYSLLVASGWKCKLPRFDPNNLHQLIRWHAVNFTHPSGLNLDLHWSILLESNPVIDAEVLHVIPRGIHPATPTYLFFQTCIHGNKKSTAPLIRWIPDAMILLKSSIDFPKLFQLAHDANLTISLSQALTHLSSCFSLTIPTFEPQINKLEIAEHQANLRGHVYVAGYYRARLRKYSIIQYLQHTANLSSPWFIPFYAPYWILYRSIRFAIRKIKCMINYLFKRY